MEHIFVQGGFAGANCVPPENQLAKFKGLYTCPTFNFSSHIQGAKALLDSSNIRSRYLVSKDVCHGVAWDREFHKVALKYKKNCSPIWDLLLDAMGSYLSKKSEGKLLHDPLAACACIDSSIITFCEVQVSRDTKGHWGSKPTPGTNTRISVGVDKQKFYSVFLDIDLDTIQSELKLKK
jgi:pyrimidine-specific ribonucleoside hydrolase